MSSLDPEKFFEEEVRKRQLANYDSETSKNATAIMEAHQLQDEKEPGMVKEQLSLGEELSVIDYLLRGYSLAVDNGIQKWVGPVSEDMEILSDYGVHYFRQAIAWYLNKNTLLSAYESEDVKSKMFDLANTINDDIFLEYEIMFKMPSLERCKQELQKRIKHKTEVRKFAYEMLGKEVKEDELSGEVLNSMEINLEKELETIREKLFNDKLKRFPSLLRFIQDTINSSYNRAIGGQERRSLRQHMQITETKGGYSMPPEVNKGGGLFKWGRR